MDLGQRETDGPPIVAGSCLGPSFRECLQQEHRAVTECDDSRSNRGRCHDASFNMKQSESGQFQPKALDTLRIGGQLRENRERSTVEDATRVCRKVVQIGEGAASPRSTEMLRGGPFDCLHDDGLTKRVGRHYANLDGLSAAVRPPAPIRRALVEARVVSTRGEGAGESRFSSDVPYHRVCDTYPASTPGRDRVARY